MDCIRVKGHLSVEALLEPGQVMLPMDLYLYLREKFNIENGKLDYVVAPSVEALESTLPDALVEPYYAYKDYPFEKITFDEHLMNMTYHVYDLKHETLDTGEPATVFNVPVRDVLPAFLSKYFESGTTVRVEWVDAEEGIVLEPIDVAIP